jgi:Flp pilus assembly protein CpaB
VLAAGTRSDQEKSRADGKPIPSTVVTLLATPEDSERIALAQTEGRVMLVLRNPLDMAPVQTPGIRMASLVGPPAPPPVEKKAQGKKVMVAQRLPQPEPVKPYTVEAIRAAKRTEEPIR